MWPVTGLSDDAILGILFAEDEETVDIVYGDEISINNGEVQEELSTQKLESPSRSYHGAFMVAILQICSIKSQSVRN